MKLLFSFNRHDKDHFHKNLFLDNLIESTSRETFDGRKNRHLLERSDMASDDEDYTIEDDDDLRTKPASVTNTSNYEQNLEKTSQRFRLKHLSLPMSGKQLRQKLV